MWALRIVSFGLVIAITRVVSFPGAIPIQMDSMTCLLAEPLGRHCDDAGLRDGNNQLWANFLTTLVRYYFSSVATPPGHPSRGLALRLAAPPMTLLGCLTASLALGVVPPINAIHLASVAESAEKKHAPALIRNALNLPQIVHCPGTTARNWSVPVNPCDNPYIERIHCADPGLEVGTFEPYSFLPITEIVPGNLPLGQLPNHHGLLRLARFRALADSWRSSRPDWP
jgi:hypothetical protein